MNETRTYLINAVNMILLKSPTLHDLIEPSGPG